MDRRMGERERERENSISSYHWRQFCPPKGHLAMSRDTFGCHNWKGTTGI